MIPTTKITVTTEIELDTATAAKWFWCLSDELQSQFFVEVAKVADADATPGDRDMQWLVTGAHLGNCECSSDGARHMLRTIVKEMNRKDPEYSEAI